MVALLVGSDALALAREPRAAPVPDFVLLDQKGRAHELARVDAKVIVLFVTGNGCPIARQTVPALKELRKSYFERGVTFWMLDANLQDDRASIAKEGDELDVDRIPILIDESQAVARRLGVTHTGEAIAIALPERRILYRGPVDDRLAVGGQRAAAQRSYLRDALEAFLGGRAIAEPVVPATGCAVGWEPPREAAYAEVGAVVGRVCGGCHRAGGAKPRFLSHADVAASAPALRKVLLERSMPPAAPDVQAGVPLAGDLALTAAQGRLLARWLDAGRAARRGRRRARAVPRRAGRRRLVARQARRRGRRGAARRAGASPEAPRLADYRPEATAWLLAIDARPDDLGRAASVSVWARAGDTRVLLGAWAPGLAPAPFPEGTGARLEPGTRLEVEVRDRAGAILGSGARVALYLAAAVPKPRRFELRAASAEAITIPAGDGEAGRAFGVYRFAREALIHDFRPRMDVRGAWFKYEALYPNGRRETLLSVPAFAGAWRLTYALAQPKRVPAGTLLLATGGYDNSRRNPANPAPDRRLTCVGRACDELFLGVVGVSEDVAPTTARAP